MERMRYRSTSLLAIQAELRQRELAAEAERAARRLMSGDGPPRPRLRLALPILPMLLERGTHPD